MYQFPIVMAPFPVQMLTLSTLALTFHTGQSLIPWVVIRLTLLSSICLISPGVPTSWLDHFPVHLYSKVCARPASSHCWGSHVPHYAPPHPSTLTPHITWMPASPTEAWTSAQSSHLSGHSLYLVWALTPCSERVYHSHSTQMPNSLVPPTGFTQRKEIRLFCPSISFLFLDSESGLSEGLAHYV